MNISNIYPFNASHWPHSSKYIKSNRLQWHHKRNLHKDSFFYDNMIEYAFLDVRMKCQISSKKLLPHLVRKTYLLPCTEGGKNVSSEKVNIRKK